MVSAGSPLEQERREMNFGGLGGKRGESRSYTRQRWAKLLLLPLHPICNEGRNPSLVRLLQEGYLPFQAHSVRMTFSVTTKIGRQTTRKGGVAVQNFVGNSNSGQF